MISLVHRFTSRTLVIALIGVLGVTFVLLVGISAISFHSTLVLMRDANTEHRAQQVLTGLASLLARASDVESTQRAYMIVGDEEYLASYDRAAQDVALEVEKLRGLITFPDQQLRLESLAPEVSRRLDRSRYLVDLRRTQGFEAIRDHALTDAGREVQERIKAIVGEMDKAEREILRQRGERTRRTARRTLALIVGTAVLSIGLVSLTLLFSRRELPKRWRAEQKLATASAWQRAILESSAAAIITSDPHAIINTFNAAAERMLGYRAEEMIGKTPATFHDADEIRNRSAELSRELGREIPPGVEVFLSKAREGVLESREWTYIRKDGSRFPASLTVTRMTDAAGNIIGYLGLATDITKRKQAEALLRAKNEELKGFAYTVSHDLKAPLRGISGYAQELERRHQTGLTERAQFCITQIITASRNLDCLIEDLLKYSRLDTETPTPTDVLLSDLVQSILRDRSHTLTELGVEVHVAVPPLKLHAWERGLHQVLSNLIDNAIKYSRQSHPPRLSITAEALPAGCRVTVTDNGIGFDMAYHDRIFGLFNRLVRANEFEGTGAGLAIVKKLMEKLGGTIRAEATLGEGATFFVELPAAATTEASS